MKKVLLLLLLSLVCRVQAQDLAAYQFYNKKGLATTVAKAAQDLAAYDVVLFGEMHNNSINHWLQLKLTEAIYQHKKQKVILGAEMFERDNQKGLDRYLAGTLTAKQLKDSVRLWNNFGTDYKPLLDFARDHQLPFVATNIPRRYATQVAKETISSLDKLPAADRQWIARLPIILSLETPGYPEMKTLMGDHASNLQIMNFISAQAVKDATMAESILRARKHETVFIHYNGNYHSKEYGGIYWYLKKADPNLKVAVITVFDSEEEKLPLPADKRLYTEYNLVLPADMTKTYE